MAGYEDELSEEERVATDMAAALQRSSDVLQLLPPLQSEPRGRQQVRDALEYLGELDRDLLVDLAFDALVLASLSLPLVGGECDGRRPAITRGARGAAATASHRTAAPRRR